MSSATQNKKEIAVAESQDQEERELPAVRVHSHGFLTLYKPGQGYWTRMGTAGGAILLLVVLAMFTYEQVGTFTQNKTIPPAFTVGVILVFGLLFWRLMNTPRNADFLIATDVEMKKVNWGTREELIGSTRIVILFIFLLAAILFAIDVLTGIVFQMMHILKFGLLS